jgi:hypothetical protein
MFVSQEHFRFTFTLCLFLLGLTFMAAGFWKLLAFGLTTQAKAIATQSVRISSKALSDDITRVTQSASQLADSVNNLLRTSAGVGAFLILVGLLLFTASYVITFILPH